MSAKEYFKSLYNETHNITAAISQYYHNDDNFYDCMLFGIRIQNSNLLVKTCWDRLHKYISQNLFNTADCGGFLTVIGYNDPYITSTHKNEFISTSEEYLILELDNPHYIRWCISLAYVLGQVYNNISYYKRCLTYDFTKFHPTILTKQLDACLKIGQTQKPLEAINTYQYGLYLFDKSLSYNLTEIIGTPQFRYPTGYNELSKVYNLAYQLSQAIEALQ